MQGFANLIGTLAWPITIAWILWKFQTPITSALGRIQRFGAGGAVVDLAVEQQAGAPDANRALAPPSNAQITPHSIFTEMDAKILAQLKTLASDPANQLAHAARWLSLAWFQHFSEIAYRLIFGSQLSLLKALTVAERDIDYARASYGQAKTAFPEFYNVYPFDQWLGFLKTASLVEEESGKLRMTARAREFLEYLRANGLSENKAF